MRLQSPHSALALGIQDSHAHSTCLPTYLGRHLAEMVFLLLAMRPIPGAAHRDLDFGKVNLLSVPATHKWASPHAEPSAHGSEMFLVNS
ncbi:hypothetical protein VDGE_30435 [Verticillium dahliae]|uniref:Uncharacterized protein n=1 Tax=Verticillium dahliae TaxID=27337 RepID=A0A444RX85_VERDA|nr:hypothetical protein VDGE_30435 [Verticillium dahliae]